MKMHRIGWTDVFGNAAKFLFHNRETGDTFLVFHEEKATKFDREEVNAILLGLFDGGRWSAAGPGTYPTVVEG